MEDKVKHFQQNTLGYDYIVGDIHGCFDKLESALQEISFDEKKDRLFSTGDLVDRGTQSADSLDWLVKPWFYAVRGNHEQMAIDYAAGHSDNYYAYNGGQWMIDLPKSRQKMYADAFQELPIAIDIKASGKLYGIIHADCPTNSWSDLEDALDGPNSEGYENVAMWCRDRYNHKDTSIVDGVELIYVGHTPLKKIVPLGNVLYIDTGACFGGALTILEIY